MRKKLLLISGIMAIALVQAWALQAEARVTEKVEAMIAENTPLKVNDRDFWIQVGAPLALGVQFDWFANANLAMGFGVGSLINGASADVSAKYYFLPGRFSPFIAGGGVFYFGRSRANIFGLFGTAGLSYFFDRGLGLSLGVTYVSSMGNSEDLLDYNYIRHTDNAVNWVSPQLGIHYNF